MVKEKEDRNKKRLREHFERIEYQLKMDKANENPVELQILGYKKAADLKSGDKIEIVDVYAWGPTDGTSRALKRYSARFIND